MKAFLKVFLPPLIAFAIFAAETKVDSLYHEMRFELISEGTFHSLMAYFYYFGPLLFIVALLTQYVIVLPVWRRVKHKKGARVTMLILLAFICLAFSVAVSYLMWGSVEYLHNWFDSCLIMMGVQTGYWLIDLLTLYLLDREPKLTKTEVE